MLACAKRRTRFVQTLPDLVKSFLHRLPIQQKRLFDSLNRINPPQRCHQSQRVINQFMPDLHGIYALSLYFAVAG
jgi:hypothetical protein